MLRYMQPFHTDYIPKVLLTGNGLHRAFEDSNWDKLLKRLSGNRFSDKVWDKLQNLPYPQLAIVATGNHLNTGMKEAAHLYVQANVLPGEDSLIKMAVDSGFDAVLTTNYSYEIEKALCPGFHISIGSASKYRKKTCKDKPKAETTALYHYLLIPQDDVETAIWHIHGEAAIPDSMIIGHYYYGRLLSRIQSYTAETIRRYKISERNGALFYPRSWVDYILFGNVFIVGQGMDLSEMDLWWLMDCKRLYGKGSTTIYKPDMNQAMTMLAEACGIKTVKCDMPKSFAEYYENTFKEIQKEIQNDGNIEILAPI